MSDLTTLGAASAYPISQLRSHRFSALTPGPRLIVLGAVHGNEVAGTRAIERVVAEFDRGQLQLDRGLVTFVPVTNPLAYQQGQRNGQRNLNRNLHPCDQAQDYEDHIANLLCPMLAEHQVLLDVHSFQAPAAAFVMLGPPNNPGPLEPFAQAEQEQALALCLGVGRVLEGWLSTYAEGVRQRLQRTTAKDRASLLSTDPSYGIGTTEYMRSQGGYAVTLECGQHQDPGAIDVAYHAIRRTLAHLGLIAGLDLKPNAKPQLLRLLQVVDRHHKDDVFVRNWSSFDAVVAGQTLAVRHDGSLVQASLDGFIVFPNHLASPGNEWFYLAQLSDREV